MVLLWRLLLVLCVGITFSSLSLFVASAIHQDPQSFGISEVRCGERDSLNGRKCGGVSAGRRIPQISLQWPPIRPYSMAAGTVGIVLGGLMVSRISRLAKADALQITTAENKQ